MRHRSPTNSHPERNVPLRSDYVAMWGDCCELWPYICRAQANRSQIFCLSNWKAYRVHYVPTVESSLPEPECHHIFRMGGRRDCWANFICCHALIHQWIHKNHDAGLVLCLYAKWKKGGRDWNLDELTSAAGKHPLGVIETYALSGVIGEWRDEMVASERRAA
jgi:hypothetical protein